MSLTAVIGESITDTMAAAKAQLVGFNFSQIPYVTV